jgi:hypothetical protein
MDCKLNTSQIDRLIAMLIESSKSPLVVYATLKADFEKSQDRNTALIASKIEESLLAIKNAIALLRELKLAPYRSDNTDKVLEEDEQYITKGTKVPWLNVIVKKEKT